jgi:hypothetical protein
MHSIMNGFVSNVSCEGSGMSLDSTTMTSGPLGARQVFLADMFFVLVTD